MTALEASAGDLLLLVADEWATTCEVLGQLRNDLGRPPVHEGPYRYLWVVDFPMFVGVSEDGRPKPGHHPFTRPHPDDIDKLESDPMHVRSRGLRPGAERLGARLGLDPDPRARAAAAGVRPARHRRRGGPPPLRVLPDPVPLRRAAARRLRLRHRPPDGDPRRRGEHPRGHRLPEDAVGLRPDDATRRRRSTPKQLAELGLRTLPPSRPDPPFPPSPPSPITTPSVGAVRRVGARSKCTNASDDRGSMDTNEELARLRGASTAWSLEPRPCGSGYARARSRIACEGAAGPPCGQASTSSPACLRRGSSCCWRPPCRWATASSHRTTSAGRLYGLSDHGSDECIEVSADRAPPDPHGRRARSSQPLALRRRPHCPPWRPCDLVGSTRRRPERSPLGRRAGAGHRRSVAASAASQLPTLAQCAARLAPAPGRSLGRVRAILRARWTGYDPGDSDLESRVLRAVVAAGLPVPRQQHRVVIGGRRRYIDLAYPAIRLALEIDSWAYHRFRSTFDADRAKSNELTVLGWRVAPAHRCHER